MCIPITRELDIPLLSCSDVSPLGRSRWSFSFLFDCRTRPVLVAMFLTRSSSFAKHAVTAFCLCSPVPGFLRSCLRFRLWGCSRLRSCGRLLHGLCVQLSRQPWPGLWDEPVGGLGSLRRSGRSALLRRPLKLHPALHRYLARVSKAKSFHS